MPRRYYALLVVFPIVALPVGCSAHERVYADRVNAVVAKGSSRSVRVLEKHTTTSSFGKGRLSHYYVIVSLDGQRLTRRVTKSTYDHAQAGAATPWYQDASMPDGFSGLEVDFLTGGMVVPFLVGLAIIVITTNWWRVGRFPMAVVRRDGDASDAGPGNRFDPPPRAETTRLWDTWTRARVPSVAPLVGCTIAIVVALIAGFIGYGAPEGALAVSLQGLLALGTLGWASWLARRRDGTLWRDGVELLGKAISINPVGGVCTYVAEFGVGGKSYRLTQRVPRECAACANANGPITLLVDPANPLRATVAPRSI